MNKKFLFLVAMGAVGLVSCGPAGEPVSKDTSFLLEVRKYNGTDSSFNPNIDGELLASTEISVSAGQITVSDAIAEVAVKDDTSYTVYLGDDYLHFTVTTVGYTTTWYLDNGYMSKEPGYTATDYSWSYMSYNDHYSNGVTSDFLDGLEVYTVVVDGYDGTIGS